MSGGENTGLAIRLRPGDNVAVVIQPVSAGQRVEITGPGDPVSVVARADIPPYHKLALAAVEDGSPLTRNGIAIGMATTSIETGDWVHIHNLVSLRGRGQQP